MSSISERIRERRLELGISVDQLAAMLGKNRATIYRYESAEIENFHISVIGPLAEALKTSPAYLMGWESKPDTAELSAKHNVVKFIGRDGTILERNLSDQQFSAILTILNQMPDAEDL